MREGFFKELASIHERTLDRRMEDAERLIADDADAFQTWFDDAWMAQDLAKVLAGGLVMQRRDVLADKARFRYAQALLAARRREEAIVLLQQLVAEIPNHRNLLSALTEALAGAGRFAEALEAARASAALTTKARSPKLDRRDSALATLCELEPKIAEGAARAADWRRYVDNCLLVGASGAVRAAAAYLARSPTVLDEADAETRTAVVKAMILAGAADDLAPVLEHLRSRLEQDHDRLALQAGWELARGSPALARVGLAQHRSNSTNLELRRVAAIADLAVGREVQGISELARLAAARAKSHEVLQPLCRAVGAQVLASADTRYRSAGGRPRVFNLLPFSNELVLLRLRMAEMADWVDHFVIVEAAQTFTGQDKPLTFEAVKAEFAEFLPKILHVRVPSFPAHLTGAWARDYHQRDMAMTALGGLWAPEDVVIITDADEIIRRDVLDSYDGELKTLVTTNHRFFFNYTAFDGEQPGRRRSSVICPARVVRRYGVSYTRFYLVQSPKGWNQILDAGWHFTSMNSAPLIAAKFSSYAHAEAVKAGWGDEERIADLLAEIKAHRYEPGWRRQELDDSFPRYVLENREALADYIL